MNGGKEDVVVVGGEDAEDPVGWRQMIDSG